MQHLPLQNVWISDHLYWCIIKMVVKTDTILHSQRCQLSQQCHNTPGYKIERCTTCRNGRCDVNLTSALSSSTVCQPCPSTVTITLATFFLICASGLGSLLSFCRMCRMCASATGACLSVSNKKMLYSGISVWCRNSSLLSWHCNLSRALSSLLQYQRNLLPTVR